MGKGRKERRQGRAGEEEEWRGDSRQGGGEWEGREGAGKDQTKTLKAG